MAVIDNAARIKCPQCKRLSRAVFWYGVPDSEIAKLKAPLPSILVEQEYDDVVGVTFRCVHCGNRSSATGYMETPEYRARHEEQS